MRHSFSFLTPCDLGGWGKSLKVYLLYPSVLLTDVPSRIIELEGGIQAQPLDQSRISLEHPSQVFVQLLKLLKLPVSGSSSPP